MYSKSILPPIRLDPEQSAWLLSWAASVKRTEHLPDMLDRVAALSHSNLADPWSQEMSDLGAWLKLGLKQGVQFSGNEFVGEVWRRAEQVAGDAPRNHYQPKEGVPSHVLQSALTPLILRFGTPVPAILTVTTHDMETGRRPWAHFSDSEAATRTQQALAAVGEDAAIETTVLSSAPVLPLQFSAEVDNVTGKHGQIEQETDSLSPDLPEFRQSKDRLWGPSKEVLVERLAIWSRDRKAQPDHGVGLDL